VFIRVFVVVRPYHCARFVPNAILRVRAGGARCNADESTGTEDFG